MAEPLLKRGPILGGMVAIFFGGLAFLLPGFLPEPNAPDGAAVIGQITGSVGGALIGLGLVMVVIGLIRRAR